MAGEMRPALLNQILEEMNIMEYQAHPAIGKAKRDCVKKLVQDRLASHSYDNKQNKGVLKEWHAVSSMLDDCYYRIIGIVNGHLICTSPVLRITGNIAETENSLYELGAPARTEYEFDFPIEFQGRKREISFDE